MPNPLRYAWIWRPSTYSLSLSTKKPWWDDDAQEFEAEDISYLNYDLWLAAGGCTVPFRSKPAKMAIVFSARRKK